MQIRCNKHCRVLPRANDESEFNSVCSSLEQGKDNKRSEKVIFVKLKDFNRCVVKLISPTLSLGMYRFSITIDEHAPLN